MTQLSAIIAILALLSSGLTLFLELRRDLMMLQQNSYRKDRYLNWLSSSGDTTSINRLIGMAVVLGSLVISNLVIVYASLILFFCLATSYNLLTAHYKKPLVMTQRASRLLIVSCFVSVIIMALIICGSLIFDNGMATAIGSGAITGVACYCGSHILILTSLFLLSPVEKRINAHYYNDAVRILSGMPGLRVIGITGSFGKTSTKHYLYTILSEQFETVMTPGSFNTTLGVVRTVRECLRPYTEVFIVEMGAKQPGDIKEICDLVHPSVGIVTAVGKQHLESFGSIENIQKTKFELIDSLPADGLAVLNDDFEMIASRTVNNVPDIRYTISGATDVTITDIFTDANGSRFTFVMNDLRIPLTTSLIGKCNISNIVAAVIVALYLGMTPEAISRGVRRIKQVEHRLSLRKTAGGIIVIDDAFNSNPVGAAMALEVLAGFSSGRRIIVTPGMIELGASQFDENRKLGSLIGSSADIAIIVGEYNREAILEGIHAACQSVEVVTVDSFNEAQMRLGSILRPGDSILYENDLPDTFK